MISFIAESLRTSSRAQSLLRLALCAMPALAFSACNSVFYQPDRLSYTLPRQVSPAYEEFRIPVGSSSDTLHVWHFRPRTASLGTVLHFHGNAQNMSAHVWFVAWLVDAGFDVVTFDYRGYGASSGVADRQKTVEDGQTVIRWLAQRQPSSPYFIVAQSLGGAVAYSALAGLKDPSPVRAMVIESSFSSYRRLARKKLSSFFLTWPFQWPLSYLVDDELTPEGAVITNPLPMLFIHGTADAVVPYSEGIEFAELAEKQKNLVSFYTEIRRGHTSCFSAQALTPCKERVLNFLNENLKNQAIRNSIERKNGR
ncbi:MAG: alpha/beta fold hydrolase [Proteobacteria bacterium]|nr:alpha/beta fold hydrolase [Pseudomonadota bacterium]